MWPSICSLALAAEILSVQGVGAANINHLRVTSSGADYGTSPSVFPSRECSLHVPDLARGSHMASPLQPPRQARDHGRRRSRKPARSWAA